jgi:hypothetical protein
VFLLGATLSLLEIRMPQLLLPIFPDAVTPVKGLLSVGKQDGRVVYFHGVLPVFSHARGRSGDVPDDYGAVYRARSFARGGRVARFRGARVECQAGVEALSAGRAERILCSAAASWSGGADGRCVEAGAGAVGRRTDGARARCGRTGDQERHLVESGARWAAACCGGERDPVRSSRAPKASAAHSTASAPMGVGASNVEARVAASVGGLNAVAPPVPVGRRRATWRRALCAARPAGRWACSKERRGFPCHRATMGSTVC